MPSLLPPPPQMTTPIKSSNLFGMSNSNSAGVCAESNDSSIQNQPTLSALNSSDAINNSDNDHGLMLKSLNGSGSSGAGDLSQSQKQLSNDQSPSQPPLARLLLSTTNTTVNTGNSSCSSSSHPQNTSHHHSHPSMTHDFLPVNLTDGEMKLELSYHYRDLQIARELVLLCSR